MANEILIIAETGNGKSTSFRNLDPAETFIINVSGKPLPFKGWASKYVPISSENPTGNYYNTDDPATIVKLLNSIREKRPEIKKVIIDDAGYIMQNEYIRRGNEVGFKKFTDIGMNFAAIFTAFKKFPDDVFVIMTMHPEANTDTFGNKTYKAKTVGKLIDNYLTIEGMFTTVLYAQASVNDKKQIEYNFITQTDGTTSAKSPMGMLEHKEPNDMQIIIEKIKEYNK